MWTKSGNLICASDCIRGVSYPLHHFGMIIYQKSLRNGKQIRKNRRLIYAIAIMGMLFVDMLRALIGIWMDDEESSLYVGDFTYYFRRPRIMYQVPIVIWILVAISINFIYITNWKLVSMWLEPMEMLSGLKSPAEVKLSNQVIFSVCCNLTDN